MRAFLFIGCCLLLASCFDTGDCLFTNTNVVKVNILNLDTPSQAKEIIFDSVFSPGRGYFYDNDTTSSLFLVVDPRDTEFTYVFHYGERADTLTLSYTNQTIVLSSDCGSYSFQNDLAIKESTFGVDQVIIQNPRLLTSVEVNIEILL